jgi:S-adenosylmethionine:tRNA ribosyltransferase-isomerase
MHTYSTADFDYVLPPELIAQHPSDNREDSKILIPSSGMKIFPFSQVIDFFKETDVLIMNTTKVIKARMHALCKRTGKNHELLFVAPLGKDRWDVMIKNSKRLREGDELELPGKNVVILINKKNYLSEILTKNGCEILAVCQQYGEVPLPPYIRRKDDKCRKTDEARYQTVYAKETGSVAAPTAGFHFTAPLLETLKEKGVVFVSVILHIGLGTFIPVTAEVPSCHVMHKEWIELSPEAAHLLNQSREKGGRLTAVGTTSLRVMESCFSKNHFHPFQGYTDLFIYPPKKVLSCDRLITNFHQPKSTLLMLVSAFSGIKTVKNIYSHAIREKMRFFSYGDAVLLEREKNCKE